MLPPSPWPSTPPSPALELTKVKKLGLVTPYLTDIQERIIANYASISIVVVAERHLEDRGNWSLTTYGEAAVASLVRDVAAARPDAITVLCTNFRGAPVVADLEAELGLPIYGSIVTTVWRSLRLARIDSRRIAGWGSLFELA